MAFGIREARADDVDQIAPWTTDTFSWGDYVGSSLSDWIGDSRLHVMVVEDGHAVAVAVARAQMLSPTEGWLDAARVNPSVRRQGLGTMLNDACVEWVREQGGRVARLAIEADNSAAHNQVLKLGYRATST
ncbi:MAG: GNAT family N-acetyltransferase, partial [Acidimicrobiia bacterium]|nr:GNAT family N-acetyltransferase [Acidimicrobiia bacterium]